MTLKAQIIVAFAVVGVAGFYGCDSKTDAPQSLNTDGTISASVKKDSSFYDDKFIHIDTISKIQYDQILKKDEWFGIDTLSKIKSMNDSLILPIDNGSSVISKNDTTNGEGYVMNQNYGVFKSYPYYLVQVNFYEGGTYYLVNKKNGKKYDVVGSPLMAPNNKLFISFNVNMMGAGQNEIQEWKLSENGLIKIFDLTPTQFMLDNVQWINDDKLAIRFNIDLMRNVYGILTLKK